VRRGADGGRVKDLPLVDDATNRVDR